jgi:Uma2 family endonuclease
MLKEKSKLTYSDYLSLSDEKRYELMEGELFVVPSPGFYHQIVSRNIGHHLWNFVKERGLGVVVHSPMDVVLSPENVVQPDILFISRRREGIIAEKGVSGAPDLVIEILSPSSQERDRLVKRDLYAEYGVPEYWLVDPEAKSITVMCREGSSWRLFGVFFLEDVLTSPLIEGYRLPVTEIFQ